MIAGDDEQDVWVLVNPENWGGGEG